MKGRAARFWSELNYQHSPENLLIIQQARDSLWNQYNVFSDAVKVIKDLTGRGMYMEPVAPEKRHPFAMLRPGSVIDQQNMGDQVCVYGNQLHALDAIIGGRVIGRDLHDLLMALPSIAAIECIRNYPGVYELDDRKTSAPKL